MTECTEKAWNFWPHPVEKVWGQSALFWFKEFPTNQLQASFYTLLITFNV